MEPFWIGLGIYVAGWVVFIAVNSLAEWPGTIAHEDIGFLAGVGIMWPVWLVIAVVGGAGYGLAWLVFWLMMRVAKWRA